MKIKRSNKPLIIVIAVCLLLLFPLKFYWDYLISPVDKNDTQVKTFVVHEGDGISSISPKLQQTGLIRSSLAFNLLSKNLNLGNSLQVGEFQISPSMSSEEILKSFTVGIADKKITLLEGWRLEEMGEKLHQTMGLNKEDFIKNGKEGYMFPDTYQINPGSQLSDVTSLLETTFNQKYTPEIQTKMKKLGLNASQGVILASIVEREGRSDEVKRAIAAILLKRMRLDMPLGVDATIQYALGYQSSEKSWWKKNLTFDDLKINSPYNTYTHLGLPPGPICNPSLSSLQAVANADSDTPYLYYYHDSQGRSHYATTLQEHHYNSETYP